MLRKQFLLKRNLPRSNVFKKVKILYKSNFLKFLYIIRTGYNWVFDLYLISIFTVFIINVKI